jgi:hypothetical protein
VKEVTDPVLVLVTTQYTHIPKCILYINQIKGNEVGRACGMHGRGEKRVQGFGGNAQRKKTT